MDRLTVPKPKDKLSVKWAQQIVNELRRLNIIPGNGIKKTTNANGTVISLDIPKDAGGGAADPATDSCFPVFITGFVGSQAYTGVSYRVVGKTYRTSSANESAEPLYFPHVTPQTTIPIGCTILAHRIEAPIIQSSTDN